MDAEEYYNGLNPTINRYEKIIYDMQGRSHTDMWTANHKLASRFFGLAVDQEVSYLLGNGVTFAEKETPKKLCPDFDQEVMDAAKMDGAGDFQMFVHLKLKYLSPTIFFVTIFSIINSFKVFREVYLR